MKGTARISVPLLKAEDVIPHLGKPGHWKEGRSAKLLAQSWFNADGVPETIKLLLASSPTLGEINLLDGWVERKTDLGDGCGAPTQTDLLALLSNGTELIVLAVEAKVDESFGPLVEEWLTESSPNKERRLRNLCARFGIAAMADVGRLRYQLIHRTAAALIEARRFHANKAVLTVQSFCPNATGFDDFANFGHAIGFGGLEHGRLAGPRQFDGIDLWIGWAPT